MKDHLLAYLPTPQVILTARNVPGAVDELLDEHAVVAEAGRALLRAQLEGLARLGVAPRDAHALPAAARRRLDHHGVPGGQLCR